MDSIGAGYVIFCFAACSVMIRVVAMRGESEGGVWRDPLAEFRGKTFTAVLLQLKLFPKQTI